MRKFNREQGTAFLIVTHDPRLAARCDRRLEMVDGCIVGDVATPQAAANPARTAATDAAPVERA